MDISLAETEVSPRVDLRRRLGDLVDFRERDIAPFSCGLIGRRHRPQQRSVIGYHLSVIGAGPRETQAE